MNQKKQHGCRFLLQGCAPMPGFCLLSTQITVMKNRAFLLLASLCFSLPMLAQGTLQFNQVLFLESSAANTVLLGTVPAGKVWKIEHVGGVPMSCYCNFSFNNSQNTAFGVGGRLVGNNYERFQNEGMVLPPIWLPAGTPVTALNCGTCYGCQGQCSNPYRYLSIIEFNVIP
jgi:hypothetical protein